MQSVLLKSFAIGFYKKYGKSMFVGFCLLFSYCFFMQTAGVFLTDSTDYWTLFISLKIATDPLLISIFWIFSLFYSLICTIYITKQLQTEKFAFLQYTLNGANGLPRSKTRAMVLSIIHLPILIYALYSLGVGYYISGKLYGILTLLYICVLITLAVAYIDRYQIFTRREQRKFFDTYQLAGGRSLAYLMTPYNQLKNNLTVLLIVKCLALVTIYISTLLLDPDEAEQNLRYLILVALTVAVFHTIILYKDFVFEGRKLKFALNLPISHTKRFLQTLPYYIILVLPEAFFIGQRFGILAFCILIGSLLLLLLQIRGFMFFIGNRPMIVLKMIATYYFIALLFILYNGQLIVLCTAIVIAGIAALRYHRYETLRDNQNE